MDTYKNIWEKNEDEILDFFHEITEPLNEMKIELEEKLNASKKIWMSDEEKLDLRICLDSVKQIFKGMEPSDLRGIVSGVLEFEADEDDEDDDEVFEYEFNDCFPIFESFDSWRNSGTVGNKENYEKYIKVQYEMNKPIVGYLWNAFGIDENPLDIMKFYETNIQYTGGDYSTPEIKQRWESYLKAFFYNREDINKAAKLLLRFYSERSKTLNGEEPKEKITEVKDFGAKGFVYFIRNKDIFKIGITDNLLRRFNQLKPDEILNVVRCSNYETLEKDLHKKFKENRIPQTEYFRLENNQIEEVNIEMINGAEF